MKYSERKSFINEYGILNDDARAIQMEFGKLVEAFAKSKGLLDCRLNEVEQMLINEIQGFIAEKRISQASKMKKLIRLQGHYSDPREPSCDSCLGQ